MKKVILFIAPNNKPNPFSLDTVDEIALGREIIEEGTILKSSEGIQVPMTGLELLLF